MSKRKICVVTGTRAEYGLLYWLMKGISEAPEFVLQIVVTGMHLSPEFGLTYRIIERDGFHIDEKVEMLLSSDTTTGVAKSIGLGVIGFADAFDRLCPDLVILLGDRFEILAAAQAALVAKIPIAHLCGGDTTEGAFDEAIRHSVTKMAHLHFVSNEQAAVRVRQLGENPEHIFNVGSPGIDQIKRIALLGRAQLEKDLGFSFRGKNLLITFHPETLGEQSSAEQFEELLKALDMLGEGVGIVITKPNADTEGRALIKMIDEFAATRPNVKAFVSLGQLKYLSFMNEADVVVGNSSSGLYEAPSFKKPSVNIGDRQKGRLRASSVFDCPAERDAIYETIKRALEFDCSETVNPYGDGTASEKILAVLKEFKDYKGLVKKSFFDLKTAF
ncbi:MAG: UDP-N-acetylglucosamine 2-epimerase (hydrolyzing) [Deltaproteobacteria bacterium]|nr:UDP-N-acetylglucosamine 2-epimerase (hydrolyzing) [Deltaproteobacteria bacterium]MBW2018616.1 UDP-N-acetylglucosamine 2-epimerase (hydrolyzing) [Deltaproteobacteria bacterium]MBW2073882.1 UDP-N-acetylglucosamine 2-epimerase (hydrolyzing) [Deltaproteobacteria bacterium]